MPRCVMCDRPLEPEEASQGNTCAPCWEDLEERASHAYEDDGPQDTRDL